MRVAMKEVWIIDGGWRSEEGAKMDRLSAHRGCRQPKVVEPEPDTISPR